MRRVHLLCGALLLALGALALVEALRIRDDWQGARLMPAALAGVLVLLGAGHLAPPREGAAEARRAWPDAAGWRRVAFVSGALVAYVALLPWLGFLPATALFVLVLLRFLGTFSWPAAIGLTAAVALAGHAVFKHWLGMPLPPGPFGG